MKILRDCYYQALIEQRDDQMNIAQHWFNEYSKLLEKHKALLLKLKQMSEEE